MGRHHGVHVLVGIKPFAVLLVAIFGGREAASFVSIGWGGLKQASASSLRKANVHAHVATPAFTSSAPVFAPSLVGVARGHATFGGDASRSKVVKGAAVGFEYRGWAPRELGIHNRSGHETTKMLATAAGEGSAAASKSSISALKAAVLAVYSVAISVQPRLIVLASKAVLKLVTSCAIGYGFSKKGILDQGALTALSKLIFFVFQPALLFVNVASTLAVPGQSLSKLMVLPAFACLQILAGAIVGNGMEKICGLEPDSDNARELRMCASFANSGPLPLLFVDSIFRLHPDPTIMTSAVAYISFYLLGWSPMFWTAGYTMLAGKPLPTAPPAEKDPEHFKKLSIFRKAVVMAQQVKASPTFKRIVSPPVLGCIAGVIAGIVPWFRNVLVWPGAPLSPIFEAIKGLGTAYLPAAILVLAGSLARPGSPGQGGERRSSLDGEFMKKVGAVMASRFVIMPFVAAVTLMTGSRAGLIPYEKLLWFILLMEGCMPSAQNSVVILQMEKKPDAAASMARTLTVVYLLSTVPIAVLLSGVLQFVQL